MLRHVTAAVDGALAGWSLGEKMDQDEKLQAVAVAAGLLIPVLFKKKALQLAAAGGLALAGYIVHELMKQDRFRVFAGPVDAAEPEVIDVEFGMN